MSFCHLHVHSNFTFGEGTSRVDDLILKAKKMGMKEKKVICHIYQRQNAIQYEI